MNVSDRCVGVTRIPWLVGLVRLRRPLRFKLRKEGAGPRGGGWRVARSSPRWLRSKPRFRGAQRVSSRIWIRLENPDSACAERGQSVRNNLTFLGGSRGEFSGNRHHHNAPRGPKSAHPPQLIARGLQASLDEGPDRVDSFAPGSCRAGPALGAGYVVGPRLLHSPERGSV
jgi:hypothetical protein